MLRPRALAAALNKMNTGGVQSVMLFNQEGVLLAFTSFAGESERLKAAIAANIWNICQRYLEAGETDMLQEIMLDFAQGRLIICRVASVLLCLHGSKEVGLGMLRAKANALLRNLEEPLRILAAS
ncbi:Mitogen-activated protein-binding protein-interacting protein [Fasciolopsis buskii]|uniref:Mitogen-activated protein-binding protein-interacting protein n=1 Tax=Fasciolopsis buskii TaxID=27845 RepID=A0A8E0VKZ4_9TREM|nr:Mitogen-activated protein-binding protein-interacting protein [Fasciolopsis buski]